jgi:hypothetical protein
MAQNMAYFANDLGLMEFAEEHPTRFISFFLAVQFEDHLSAQVAEQFISKQLYAKVVKHHGFERWLRRKAESAENMKLALPALASKKALIGAKDWLELLSYGDMFMATLDATTFERRNAQRKIKHEEYARRSRVFLAFRLGLERSKATSAFVPLALDLFVLLHQRSANLRFILREMTTQIVDRENEFNAAHWSADKSDVGALGKYVDSWDPNDDVTYSKDLKELLLKVEWTTQGLIKALAIVRTQHKAVKPLDRQTVPRAPVLYSIERPAPLSADPTDPIIERFRSYASPHRALSRGALEWMFILAHFENYSDPLILYLESATHPALAGIKRYRSEVIAGEADVSIENWQVFAVQRLNSSRWRKDVGQELFALSEDLHVRFENLANKPRALLESDAAGRVRRIVGMYTPHWKRLLDADNGGVMEISDEAHEAVAAFLRTNPRLSAKAFAEIQVLYFPDN